MENRDDATVPAQKTTNVKGRDFEPVPSTAVVKPDDPPAGPKPPFDFDPAGDPPESGEPRH
jgi:hypothetical protein